jgi:hypothetical protein
LRRRKAALQFSQCQWRRAEDWHALPWWIATKQCLRQHELNIELNATIALKDIWPLTDFRRNTKSHLRRLRKTGRAEILTVNGKPELIVQNAAAYEEMIEAIRGIRRGLDAMAAGQGGPARKVLDRIRARHKISKASL